ncbi:hypothetical protein MMC30_003122 [Trapelia coarctata]|nr:hypothetical protein [Trapelia coarctata]
MRLCGYPFACLVAGWIGRAACQYSPASQPPSGEWLGWGADVFNNRWAAPGSSVDSSNAGSLVKSCTKSYEFGVSATPVVQDGIAYYPTWDGRFVALNYKTCSTLWEVNVKSLVLELGPPSFAYLTNVSRTSATLDGDVLYFGTQLHALLVAVDRRSGKFIDSIQMNPHPLAVISQSPTAWKGIVYVGCSSMEEAAAGILPGYKCCSFIGNFAAVTLDKKSQRLKILWNQAMVPADSGFSGVGVWGGQPSIDADRQQVFIATGNVYSLPESAQECQNQTLNVVGLQRDPCTPPNVYAEAIVAFDLITGLINWVNQLSALDAWNVACTTPVQLNPGACPPNPGPDADFGMAPTFVPGSAHTPHGKDTVIIGQKNGNLYAISAQAGTLFWVLPTSPGGIVGGLIFGLAVDDTAVYYTAVNSLQISWHFKGSSTNITNSAFGAASLSDGQILWETQSPMNSFSEAAPSVVNDVVFTGRTGVVGPGGPGSTAGTGGLVALNKKTGAIIRDYPLAAYFFGNAAIVDNYVLFGDGYATFNGTGAFNVWRAKKG